jgi:Flp pilus assembly protein TadD
VERKLAELGWLISGWKLKVKQGKAMKHIIISLGVATLIAGVNPVVQALPMQLAQQAEDLLDRGDFKAALEIYNQALQQNTNDSSALVGRGMARIQLGDKQGALEDLTQALQIAPGNADIYRKRGGVYMILGKERQAQEDFQRADSLLRGGQRR